MEVSSSKSSSSLTASVLEARDYQAQRAPHPFPDFGRAPSPRCVTVGVQLQQEMWKKTPEFTSVKTSCLFSLGSNLCPGSSEEQKFPYKSDASIPESSQNPFRCPRSTARTSRQGSEFPCCSPCPCAAWQAQAPGTPRSEQPCKEQRVLTKIIWFLSYPGDDQNTPEIGLSPVLPGEIAPHYYEFKVTLVPPRLPDFFLYQNCSELIKMSIWV